MIAPMIAPLKLTSLNLRTQARRAQHQRAVRSARTPGTGNQG
jgi:hypothetical protein